MYQESNDSIVLNNVHSKYEFNWQGIWGNAKEYEEQYLHQLWKDYIPRGGHDGMDWLVFRAFIESVKAQTQTPIDVYDTATLMSISALSEQSIVKGGAPVEIPDFTRGRWFNRTDLVKSPYCLFTV